MIIAVVRGIQVNQDTSTVSWTSGAAIDSDGANGQVGNPFSYRYPDDKGLDRLRDAEWPHGPWRSILVDDGDGHPLTDGNGNAYSRTAYAWRGRGIATRYVDATSVPYVVVNPHVRINARGVIMGCSARVDYNGKTVDCVVADVSGPGDIGEISIAAAKALGIPDSPLTGGVDSHVSFYLYPDQPAVINGETYQLQAA